MKNGWQTKTLSDLFEITSSKRVFEADWKREGVPFYRAREIVKLAKWGHVNNELFISEEMFNTYSAKYGIPTPGDIMVTGVGTLGICYVVKEGDRFYFKDGNIIWLKKRSDADSRFVEYAFQSDYLREQIDDSAGATVGTYTIIKAKNTRIPIPPLSEQQRIVRRLDEAFAGIATAKANAEKNLQNARVLFASHLQSVFTQRGEAWVESTIGSETRFIDYRGKTPVKTSSGVRLITAKNVKMGFVQEKPMEFIASANYKSWMTRGIPKKGDVLFTTEAPLANVAQLDTDEKVAFAQRIIIMQPNPAKLDSTFLKYLLLSQPVQDRIRTKGTGATVQGIKASLLKTIEISFPMSLSEQAQIVTTIDGLTEETNRLESIYKRKLAALEELKKSLLHQAFRGEL